MKGLHPGEKISLQMDGMRSGKLIPPRSKKKSYSTSPVKLKAGTALDLLMSS